jgi:hypothetical protein
MYRLHLTCTPVSKLTFDGLGGVAESRPFCYTRQGSIINLALHSPLAAAYAYLQSEHRRRTEGQ